MSELAIVGATLVDAVGPEPVERSAVVIDRDGRIAAVGPLDRVRVPTRAVRIEADGLTLLPGLVDCHAHLALGEWTRGGGDARGPTDIVVGSLESGRRWVEHGVTTVRDAWGASAGIRRAFASGAFPGPRLQVSLSTIHQSGGHGIGPGHPAYPLIAALSDLAHGPADGVDGVRRAARLRIAAGADWLKVAACGWRVDADAPDTTQLTVDELRAAVDEAAAAGIHGVMAHTQGPRSIKNALAAGVRSIDHGDLIDEEAIELMKRLDAALVVQGPFAIEPDAQGLIDGVTPAYWEVQRAHVAAAAEAGVRIVLGSDALGDGLPHPVLAHLAACGLGPMGAIRAATIEGARLLGIADEVGSIEPGKRADLLLFDGDPLGSPGQWREPGRVVLAMQSGRVLADRRSTG